MTLHCGCIDMQTVTLTFLYLIVKHAIDCP